MRSFFTTIRNHGAMVRTIRNILGGVAVVALVGTNVGAGCSMGAAKPTSYDVALEYRPKVGDPAPAVQVGQPGSVKLYVSAAVDKRQDPKLIGHNQEDSTPIPIYGTGKTPADLLTEVLRQELRDSGLDVLNDVSASTRTIDAELIRFEVTETGSYVADVKAIIKVVDPTGTVVWQKTVAGTGKNWGKSLNAGNYQETYSKALKELTNSLLSDSQFIAALSAK